MASPDPTMETELDATAHAKLAALWILHGRASADLLRAHARVGHAANLDAALDELIEIVAARVGRRQLARALDWASDELWGAGDRAASPRTN
jgi:hypothetical protein